MRFVYLALDEFEAGGALFRSPLTPGHFEQAPVSCLLAAQPNSTAALVLPPTVGSRAVRRVLDLIES